MYISMLFHGDFGEKVLGNLINYDRFCTSCGDGCESCRSVLPSFADRIVTVFEAPDPKSLPPFVDDGEKYLPDEIPQVDIMLAIDIHPDLLLALPKKLADAGVKALIVPIERPSIPPGLARQVMSECEELGVECAFPKPFCTLDPLNSPPTIARFCHEFRIGKPLLMISTKKDPTGRVSIASATVLRSAPCGSTWYIAQQLKGVEVDPEKLRAAISKAHHSYPCTASMDKDPETDEPFLHIGGFMAMEAVFTALNIPLPADIEEILQRIRKKGRGL